MSSSDMNSRTEASRGEASAVNSLSRTSVSGSPGRLLLRNVSQSSLDESSQKQPGARPFTREKSPYFNAQHAPKAFETMNLMRKEKLLCDVILEADDVKIPAHKMVLAACSPYFYAMFNGFEERSQDRVTIREVEGSALELLVDYIYSSKIHVTEDNTLLPAANLLQLPDVRNACSDFLASQLHPSNCLGIRAFADLHACSELFHLAEAFAETHFSEVCDEEEFLSLDVEQVCQLISSDRLRIPSEEKVFECVMQWLKHDLPNRETNTVRLIEHVRLPLMSKEFVVHRVESEPLMRTHSSCKDFLIEALKYHHLEGEERHSYKSARTRPRQPVGLPKVMLVVGGQAPKAIRSVECYDFAEERWYQVAEMPSRRCRAGLAVLNGLVYAVGGFNGSLRVRTVDIYDPVADSWCQMPSMEARRSTLGVAVLNGVIYAVGGFDGSTGLNTAECFDPEMEEWRMIASMSVRRSSVGVGVINGLLYAVGGYDGASRQCLSSVECYDPKMNRWSLVAEMSARRSGASVGVLEGQLYAVGGHDGPLVRKSVETYNPDTNMWAPVADMALCRRNAGVVSLGGLLYVVGGDDGSSNLPSVEVYNPKTNAWNLLPSQMGTGRSYAGVAIIDKPL